MAGKTVPEVLCSSSYVQLPSSGSRSRPFLQDVTRLWRWWTSVGCALVLSIKLPGDGRIPIGSHPVSRTVPAPPAISTSLIGQVFIVIASALATSPMPTGYPPAHHTGHYAGLHREIRCLPGQDYFRSCSQVAPSTYHRCHRRH